MWLFRWEEGRGVVLQAGRHLQVQCLCCRQRRDRQRAEMNGGDDKAGGTGDVRKVKAVNSSLTCLLTLGSS